MPTVQARCGCGYLHPVRVGDLGSDRGSVGGSVAFRGPSVSSGGLGYPVLFAEEHQTSLDAVSELVERLDTKERELEAAYALLQEMEESRHASHSAGSVAPLRMQRELDDARQLADDRRDEIKLLQEEVDSLRASSNRLQRDHDGTLSLQRTTSDQQLEAGRRQLAECNKTIEGLRAALALSDAEKADLKLDADGQTKHVHRLLLQLQLGDTEALKQNRGLRDSLFASQKAAAEAGDETERAAAGRDAALRDLEQRTAERDERRKECDDLRRALAAMQTRLDEAQKANSELRQAARETEQKHAELEDTFSLLQPLQDQYNDKLADIGRSSDAARAALAQKDAELVSIVRKLADANRRVAELEISQPAAAGDPGTGRPEDAPQRVAGNLRAASSELLKTTIELNEHKAILKQIVEELQPWMDEPEAGLDSTTQTFEKAPLAASRCRQAVADERRHASKLGGELELARKESSDTVRRAESRADDVHVLRRQLAAAQRDAEGALAELSRVADFCNPKSIHTHPNTAAGNNNSSNYTVNPNKTSSPGTSVVDLSSSDNDAQKEKQPHRQRRAGSDDLTNSPRARWVQPRRKRSPGSGPASRASSPAGSARARSSPEPPPQQQQPPATGSLRPSSRAEEDVTASPPSPRTTAPTLYTRGCAASPGGDGWGRDGERVLTLAEAARQAAVTLNALRSEVALLESDRGMLQEAIDTRDRQLNSAMEQLSALSAAERALQRTEAGLRADVDDARKLAARLQQQLAEERGAGAALGSRVAELEQLLDQRKSSPSLPSVAASTASPRVHAKVDAAERALADLTHQRERGERRLAEELEAVRTERQSFGERLETLQGALAEKEAELAALRRASKPSSPTGQASSLRRELDGTLASLAEKEAELAALRHAGKPSSPTGQVSSLRRELDGTLTALAEKEAELAALRRASRPTSPAGQVSSLRRELDGALASLAEKEAELAALRRASKPSSPAGQASSLRRELDEVLASRDRLLVENAELAKQKQAREGSPAWRAGKPSSPAGQAESLRRELDEVLASRDRLLVENAELIKQKQAREGSPATELRPTLLTYGHGETSVHATPVMLDEHIARRFQSPSASPEIRHMRDGLRFAEADLHRAVARGDQQAVAQCEASVNELTSRLERKKEFDALVAKGLSPGVTTRMQGLEEKLKGRDASYTTVLAENAQMKKDLARLEGEAATAAVRVVVAAQEPTDEQLAELAELVSQKDAIIASLHQDLTQAEDRLAEEQHAAKAAHLRITDLTTDLHGLELQLSTARKQLRSDSVSTAATSHNHHRHVPPAPADGNGGGGVPADGPDAAALLLQKSYAELQAEYAAVMAEVGHLQDVVADLQATIMQDQDDADAKEHHVSELEKRLEIELKAKQAVHRKYRQKEEEVLQLRDQLARAAVGPKNAGKVEEEVRRLRHAYSDAVADLQKTEHDFENSIKFLTLASTVFGPAADDIVDKVQASSLGKDALTRDGIYDIIHSVLHDSILPLLQPAKPPPARPKGDASADWADIQRILRACDEKRPKTKHASAPAPERLRLHLEGLLNELDRPAAEPQRENHGPSMAGGLEQKRLAATLLQETARRRDTEAALHKAEQQVARAAARINREIEMKGEIKTLKARLEELRLDNRDLRHRAQDDAHGKQVNDLRLKIRTNNVSRAKRKIQDLESKVKHSEIEKGDLVRAINDTIHSVDRAERAYHRNSSRASSRHASPHLSVMTRSPRPTPLSSPGRQSRLYLDPEEEVWTEG
ncbi:hypothetical protein DIPPA_31228 [Diplonema papillatum]|nr:hypothetical protein DIPPA_31228 [Diplonema papillatum]